MNSFIPQKHWGFSGVSGKNVNEEVYRRVKLYKKPFYNVKWILIWAKISYYETKTWHLGIFCVIFGKHCLENGGIAFSIDLYDTKKGWILGA